MLSEDIVRRLMRGEWVRQGVVRESDRDRVFDALMKDSSPPADGTTRCRRGSLKPLFDGAVDTLVKAFANGPPADPIDTVWRAFPRLTKENCAKLAQLLIEANTTDEGRPR